MTKQIFRISFIFIFVLFINGCASLPKYVGYKGADAAVLSGGNTPNIFSALANNSATRVSVDGKFADNFYLKPGEHTVLVWSNSLSIFSPLSAEKALVLGFKPNRKYKITSKSSIATATVTFFLFDITGQKEKLLREFHARGFIQ